MIDDNLYMLLYSNALLWMSITPCYRMYSSVAEFTLHFYTKTNW